MSLSYPYIYNLILCSLGSIYFTTTGFSDFPQTLWAYTGLRTLALTFPLKLLPDSLLDDGLLDKSLLQGSFTSFLSLWKCPLSYSFLEKHGHWSHWAYSPLPLFPDLLFFSALFTISHVSLLPLVYYPSPSPRMKVGVLFILVPGEGWVTISGMNW